MRVRFARTHEIEQALKDIKAWGYRDLEHEEAKTSCWGCVEKEGIVCWWWLEYAKVCPLGDAIFHACARPEIRGRLLTRHVVESVDWILEFSGANRLWATPPVFLHEVMRKMGWKEPVKGCFVKELS